MISFVDVVRGDKHEVKAQCNNEEKVIGIARVFAVEKHSQLKSISIMSTETQEKSMALKGNQEKLVDARGAQFENFNDMTDANFKEDTNSKYTEILKDGNPMEDSIQKGDNKSTSVDCGSSSNCLKNKSAVCMAHLESGEVKRSESLNFLNGVSDRLKTLLTRDTPIKEKLEVKKAKDFHPQDFEMQTMGNEGDYLKARWFKQRVIRSQSRKNLFNSSKVGPTNNGCDVSNSSGLSVNVAHRLEEIRGGCGL
ncbi:hypothetical protein L1887_14883 [Cichorium endivia]|nr:hypothetical protein L1887_14883 [Cichorium endivia]